jgi:hypothetical protein
VIRRDHIAAVLNLRGAHPGRSWYDREVAAAMAAGAAHLDLGLSADHEPDDATLGRLIAILRTAPKPLPIHCRSGADRSRPDVAATAAQSWPVHHAGRRKKVSSVPVTTPVKALAAAFLRLTAVVAPSARAQPADAPSPPEKNPPGDIPGWAPSAGRGHWSGRA